MDDQQTQTLISTLMQGGLASSEGEARRMAEDMLGTTAKVQDEYTRKKEKLNMFASEIAAKGYQSPRVTDDAHQEIPDMKEPQTQIKSPVQESQVKAPTQIQENSTAMQNKIQELRKAALNPQPVSIQVKFQTPQLDKGFIQNNTNTIKPQFSQEEANQAVQNNIQKDMPSVDFQIPGVNSNMTINELANSKPQTTQQQDNFFSQEQSTPQNSFIKSEIKNESVQKQPIQTNNIGLESGFPTNNQSSINQSNDFLQVKEEPQKNDVRSSSNSQEENNSQHATNTPKRNVTWTEEEKKLKEDVDLSKIFNFNNK